nr:immunoglobulin heavy chain junction region [Macaca mulatta]MOW45464.1 immunoglobulin heavy chain junction region [Macaca mulatta]MOW45659.1 immunoglobulin heavy chain junction region [Macaca mulatta]MOW45777.1 immunoglobulin heavy chain junction region [Macaca mulatta]MOW46630.1 immunoglobulin heavy chain junction region [Macaca mulatta]
CARLDLEGFAYGKSRFDVW